MSSQEIVTKKVKVLQAEYIFEEDCILIIGEIIVGDDSSEPCKQKISSSCFSFGTKNKVEEMEKTALMMNGKILNLSFDPSMGDA